MSYQLFKPDRFLCEPELSSCAFNLKIPAAEFADPATAHGIIDKTTIPSRYYLSKTVLALTTKPGLKVERPGKDAENRAADFYVSWIYGCPHRCAYCRQIHLCKNYPYIAVYPKIEEVEDAIRRIAADWQGERAFLCDVGAMTDILAFEHLTGWLSRLVLLFANEIAPHGQLQFTTRSASFAPLLALNHRRATRVSLALAPEKQIREMEPGTAALSARLDFLSRAIAAGYPVRISLSPVILTENYERDYERLFEQVARALLQAGSREMADLSVEVSLHYVKPECEALVEELAPRLLDGLVSSRVESRARLAYPKDLSDQAARYFRRMLPQYLPNIQILFIA